MGAALYYPHIEVKSESIVRTALLIWDQLEFIVPWKGFDTYYRKPLMSCAIELVGTLRAPTPKEQKDVHMQVVDLLTDGCLRNFVINRKQ